MLQKLARSWQLSSALRIYEELLIVINKKHLEFNLKYKTETRNHILRLFTVVTGTFQTNKSNT